MTTYRRNGTWSCYVSVKGKRIRRGGFATEQEAAQAEAMIRASLMTGQPIQAVPVTAGESAGLQTLQGLFNFVMNRYWADTPSEDTHRINATSCIYILGGDRHPATVTEADLDRLITKFRAANLAGGTINRKLAALRRMLTIAQTRGVIARLPTFELVPEAEHRIRFWSEQEERRILEYFEFVGDQDMADLFVVLTDTGIRLGSALRLSFKWNVDPGLRQIVLHADQTKAKHPQAIPLTTRAGEVLGRRREAQAIEGRKRDRVFDAVTKDSAEHRWKQCRTSVGLEHDPQAVLHTCRHTFVSRLVQCGVPLPVVQKLAGHKNIQTTMRYAHLRAADMEQAIEKMEKRSSAG